MGSTSYTFLQVYFDVKENLIYFFFQRGVFVAGLREEIVNDAEQVLELIQKGEGLTS